MNMTTRSLLIAVAALSSLGAQADEADASQFATIFETSSRTRAEVHVEATAVPRTRSTEPAGSRVTTYTSTADRAAVRAQASDAVRSGRIQSGEIG
jgi:predicted outer membrane protein